MAISDRRRRMVLLLWRRVRIIGLALLLILALSALWGVFQKERESAGLRADSEQALSDMTTQKSKLQSDIAKLQSERGKEETLRDQYAVGKPGEGLMTDMRAFSTPSFAR